MRRQTMLEVLKISATYAGTIIGAGFASGQEIMRFFIAYGSMGFWGILLAGCLFAWLGGTIMELGHRLKATGYHQLIYHVLGPKIGFSFDIIAAVFLFGVFTIMLAGAGTVFTTYYLPYNAGLLCMAVAALLTTLRGVQGIAKVNTVITPLLALATIIVGTCSLIYHGVDALTLAIPPQPSLQAAPHWLLGCLLYVSYNLVIGSTVLAPLGAYTHNYKIRLWGSFIGSLFLSILAAFVTMAIILHYPQVLLAEVPMLEISGMQHISIYSLYAFILLTAMYTTSIACLYGCAVKLQSTCGFPFFLCCSSLVVVGLLASQAGFSQLISLIFPLFGYLSFWFILKLIWLALRGN